MTALPTGTVTFLFTDIEGSTRLLQQLGDAYTDALLDCRRLVRTAVQERGGQEVDTEGDAVFAAFPSAREALVAAVTAQQSILRHRWPEEAAVRVRIGLHTGEARVAEGGYVGMDVHRSARICAAAHGGQILLSDTAFALVINDLPNGVSLRDLGEHRLKDLDRPLRLFQVLVPDLPSSFPPLRSLDAHRHNLPIQLTSFIGRAREVAAVKESLSTARLVTLTGTGGAGKTRLALQVAADLVEDYPDGVWFAEFAPIVDPTLVPKTVASALNLPEQPGREMTETLVQAFRPKALLLVLDNCEHLLTACRDLAAALLRTCPQVSILATSREGLGVPGETLFSVPSLSLPDVTRHSPSPEELVLYDAVRLFVDRAMATTPGFTVTSENAPAVAQVCQRLDGIPLAIELAAARVKVLAVEQIVARLDDRFRLLTGGSQTLLPRQQTLRATLDWSYGLLSDQERTLLRRLSVFAGGWALEAAEAVCAGGGVEPSDILDLLTQLVDKSLVIAEIQGGEARYRLLETVREYGRDRLTESNEAAVVRRKHRDWCLDLAAKAEPKLRGPEQKTWVDQLETEHDNFRAALAWSNAEPDGAEAGLRLAGLLWWFWYIGGHAREGRNWLEGALARSGDAPPAAMPAAIIGAMNFAAFQNDNSRATELGAQGLATCRQVGDRRNMALLLTWLGSAARREGDYERATTLLQDSMAIAYDLGDKWTIGLALGHLGIIARLQGDADRATTLHTESLSLSKEMGYASHIAFNLGLLCDDALYQDDYARAASYCIEGLKLSQQLGHRSFTRDFLDSAAAVACGQGKYERAARLLGAAGALRETIGDHRSPLSEVANKRRIASTRKGLGDSAFEEAWAEGRAMMVEQAIKYTLAAEDG